MEWVFPPPAHRPLLAGVLLVVMTTPVASDQITRSGQLPTLPMTQLDERAPSPELDGRTVSMSFVEPVALGEALMAVVRGSNLSIASEPSAGGTFSGELKNVTIRQGLDLILEPRGLRYTVDGNVVRVMPRAPDTRIFDINYIAADRSGTSRIGFEGTGGAAPFASVTTTTHADVFADLTSGIRALLSPTATFNLDRKAGLLQVTDFTDRLDRVAVYLDAVQDRIHRQAQIDARVLEVLLSDEKAAGVDWNAIVTQLEAAPPGGGPRPPRRPSLTGMRVTDVQRFLKLLEGQGTVTVLAAPQVLTMNNEPAIVRSDAVTLAVTPQISGDSYVTLSISPIVRSPQATESDSVARVADGETLVMSGFTTERETRERKAVGSSGGWFGRSTVVTKKRVELVILLTPRIVQGVGAP